MYIETPLRAVNEVLPLVQAGADVFYCGVADSTSVNNRNNTILHQFESFSLLKEAVGSAHEYGKKVYLTLNSNRASIRDSLHHAGNALYAGVDGFIVTNIHLVDELMALNEKVPVYLSVLAGIYNSECLRFYLRPNIKGFCFERNISIQNMKEIISQFPHLKATAFVSGNCQNSQVICYIHNLTTKVPVNKHEGGFGEMICEGWCTGNHFSNDGDKGKTINKIVSRDWCALCSLVLLKIAGVRVLKIEGRSLELPYKIRKVSMYREAIDNLELISDRKQYYDYCKSVYKKMNGFSCCNTDCYYRI